MEVFLKYIFTIQLLIKQSFIILASLLLFSCGGGGSDDSGGGSTPPPANKAPTANAGEDQVVNEGNAIALTGSGTDSDGSISSYSWTQTSGGSVTINDSTSSAASFDITTATQVTLTFQITVIDNDGATGIDTVNFIVNPVNTTPVNVAPVLASIEDKVTYQDTSIEITLAASDSNNDSLIFNASLLNNANLNIEISNEILSITPINQYFGDEVITVSVSDGELEDSTDFALQVLQISIPPVAQIKSNELSTPPPMPEF